MLAPAILNLEVNDSHFILMGTHTPAAFAFVETINCSRRQSERVGPDIVLRVDGVICR